VGRPTVSASVRRKRCSRCGEVKGISKFVKRNCCVCKTCRQIRRTEHHILDPRPSMRVSAQRRALRKGIPFDLSVDDIVIPEVCPVLGIPLFVTGGVQTDNSPSLDRFVDARGYVRGNIAVMSLKANRIKNDASAEELRTVAAWMDRNAAT
jgi:hypothetical protein